MTISVELRDSKNDAQSSQKQINEFGETTAKGSSRFWTIYRYADRYDFVLMILGSLSAIVAGITFPLLLILYKRVLNDLMNLGIIAIDQRSISNGLLNSSVNCSDTCRSLSNTESIDGTVKYYCLLGGLAFVLYWFAWSTWMISGERQIRRMRFALFRNILRQEIAWFDQRSTGALNSQLVADLTKIQQAINEKVPDFIANLSKTIGCLIYSFFVGWKLTLIYLSVSPFIIILFNVTIKIIIEYTKKEAQAFGEASSIAYEVLQNIRIVTAFGTQEKEVERFNKTLIKSKRVAIRKGVITGICISLHQIFSFLAMALTFWYGPYLVRITPLEYSAGAVLTVFVACLIATNSAAQFIPNIQNFAEALASAVGVFALIQRSSKIDVTDPQGDRLNGVHGNIEFDHVQFTYPTRKDAPILTDVSLNITAGQTVALVGSSGCGKSTIIQLIQRFYDPDQGRILLDGKDIRSLNVSWFRSQIAIVSQEPVLFPGSIQDNIRLGKPDATMDEIQEAAMMANAHNFIMELPGNYAATSSDKLSGGEKQRIAIARALISNPKILLLDEATSALDNNSESIVQDAIKKAKQGRTTIIIAHRLSTIRHADVIIGLDKGSVFEYGTHDELMAKRGLYYELVVRQSGDDKDEQLDDSDDEEQIDPKIHSEICRQISLARTLSKQSSYQTSLGDEIETDRTASNLDEFGATECSCQKPFSLKILRYNTPEWYWILIGSLASILVGAVQPLFAVFLSKIFAVLASPDFNEQTRLTNFYAIIIFLIGLLAGICEFLNAFSFAQSGEALTMRMRRITFSALLRQDMSFFDHQSNSIGSLITQLSSDSSELKGLAGIRLGTIFQSIGSIVVALIIGFTSGWKLTLVGLCFAPFLIVSGLLQGRRQTQAGKDKDEKSSRELATQHATVAMDHIRTVVSLQQEKRFVDLFELNINKDFRKNIAVLQQIAIASAVGNSIIYFLYGVNFSYGSHLVVKGEMEFQNVYRIFLVMLYAMTTVGRALALIPNYSKAKSAAIRILCLSNEKSSIDPTDSSGIILNQVNGDIQFQNVRFRYFNRPNRRILRNFSLSCPKETATALVGPSGSGKSTTIALLLRFYDPWQGRILLDGHDIKILNLQWLRSVFGYVQQEPVLFNMTIAENIAYGMAEKEVNQNLIESAAKMANAHELICSLPQGYQTMCGAKGNQLSGGQKQRIAIARALIRSPKILLFDEATSALDTKSEQIVQTAIDQIKSGRTCLTVAHRLSTIRNCEQIAVVECGKLSEKGTHDELMKLKKRYWKLSSIQDESL